MQPGYALSALKNDEIGNFQFKLFSVLTELILVTWGFSGLIYLFIQATPLFQGVSCDLLTNL